MSPYAGSHPYVAPEVGLKQPSGGLAIDTFSFAVILWSMMALKEKCLKIYDFMYMLKR
jgi:serine/threonine protein kinase